MLRRTILKALDNVFITSLVQDQSHDCFNNSAIYCHYVEGTDRLSPSSRADSTGVKTR